MRMRKKRHGTDRLFNLSRLLYSPRYNFKDYDENQHNENIEIPPCSPAQIKPECPYLHDAPLRVEIGCGKGGFICGLSKTEADCNYVALERITDVIIAAVEKYAVSRGLGELDGGGTIHSVCGEDEDGRYAVTSENAGNVRFLNVDADDLERYFEPESIERIYINFCDPWTKKGYTKRRLTYIGYLEKYFRLLQPGGTLYFKTDDRPLYDFSLEQFEKSAFIITDTTTDLHSSPMASDNVMTEYEQNFSSKGVPINAIHVKKPL